MKTVKGVVLIIAAIGAFSSLAFGQCFQGELRASHGTGSDSFGRDLAIDGDFALVAAPGRCHIYSMGSAFLYHWDGTSWQERDELYPGVFGLFDLESVAIDEDVIVLGFPAPFTHPWHGALFIYRRVGNRWHTDWIFEPHRGFGWNVGVEDDVIATTDFNNTDGAIRTYRWDENGWVERASARPNPGEIFTGEMILDRDVMFVSAIDSDAGTGLVAVLRWNGFVWHREARLLPPVGEEDFGFGGALAYHGNRLIVGSVRSAYIFRDDGTTWVLESALSPDHGKPDSRYGQSVAIGDQVAFVGAHNHQHGDSPGRGVVFAYRFREGQWIETGELTSGDDAGFRFGFSLDWDSDRLLVGFVGDDDGSGSGSVHVHDTTLVASHAKTYGMGWPGTLGIADLNAVGPPALGGSIILEIGNSLGADTDAFMLVGLEALEEETPLGGQLLVSALFHIGLSLPGAGLPLPAMIPDDPALLGTSIFIQVLEIDAGASKGVSFTAGLELMLGEC